MFKKPEAQVDTAQVQPIWERLVKQKRSLQRNVRLCRVVQPVGTLIFLWNLLLVTANFALFLGGDIIQTYFVKVPILPKLVESFPRGSWGGIIAFSLCFAYLIPLAISGIITAIFYVLDRKKYQGVAEPLNGTEAECAKALAHMADTVYELRKKIPTWSIFAETSILTGLTAIPIAYTCVAFARGEDPAVLQFSIGCFALLVCLFGLFWVYALLFKLFSLLNSLFYYSSSEWTLYEQYQKLDAYWESVDPVEFAKRDRAAKQRAEMKQQKRRSRRKQREEEAQDLAQEVYRDESAENPYDEAEEGAYGGGPSESYYDE